MNSKFHIYFANLEPGSTHGLELPAIIFRPSSDNWNDFGLRTRFTYQVIEKDRQGGPGEVHLAFLEEKSPELSPTRSVETKLRQAQVNLLSAREFPGFYTMHFGMDSYREIVRNYGPDQAEGILLAINDLVAIRRAGRLPKWFNQATSSHYFTLAFVRDAGTFFAFHNAASILDGLERETLRGISNRLRLEFKLASFTSPHVLKFSFEYDGELAKRIAIIIGKNGVGKSQALANFSQSLLRGDKRLRDGEGNVPRVNRLLAVSSPGETRRTFPPRPKRPRIFYRRIVLSHNFYSQPSHRI